MHILATPTIDRPQTQAEEMRLLRNQEARQLIGGSVNKAKAIFIQNISSAATAFTKPVKTAPAKPVRNSIARSTSSQDHQSPDRKAQVEDICISSSWVSNEMTRNLLSESAESKKIQSEVYIPNNNNNGNDENVDQPTGETRDHTLASLSPIYLPGEAPDEYSDAYSTIKRSPYTKSNVVSNESKSGTIDLQVKNECTSSYGE